MDLDLETLQRDGYVVITDVLDEEALAQIKAAISTLYERAKKEPLFRVGGTLHVDGLTDMSEPFSAVWTDPRVVRGVRALLGDEYRVTRAHVRSPLPNEGAQALHADYPARPADGGHAVATAIVAIEAFTEKNGSTRVLPGSHDVPPSGVPTDGDTCYPGERMITMAAGSVLLFSGHLFHSGTRNRSQTWRDALQITFSRPDARLYG